MGPQAVTQEVHGGRALQPFPGSGLKGEPAL